MNHHLSLDLVPGREAVPTAGRSTLPVLVHLTAPDAERVERPSTTVVVVLDRSGSMGGGRLAAARKALEQLVARLDPRDSFGLITFDHTVEVLVPAAPLVDREGVLRRVREVRPGGSTNLGGGLHAGVREAVRAAAGTHATVVVVSDGHANVGVTDHDALASLAAEARGQRVTVSTIGVGLGYDEDLLAAVARGGTGSTYFAEGDDDVVTALGAEVEGLLSVTAVGVSLAVGAGPAVAAIELVNDLPCALGPAGITVAVGELYAGERRSVLLNVEVDGTPEPGRLDLASVTATWSPPGSLVERFAEASLTVVAVHEAELDGFPEAPAVVAAAAFQAVQRSRREAADLLHAGDLDGARSVVDASIAAFVAMEPLAAAAVAFDETVESLQAWRASVGAVSERSLRKSALADAYRGSAKSGRRRRRGDER